MHGLPAQAGLGRPGQLGESAGEQGKCCGSVPRSERTPDSGIEHTSLFPVWQASSEMFIPIFANNPRELRAFLEHMIDVDPLSSQGVYDTLLELRLQDWAHEQDAEVMSCPGTGV